MKLYWFISRNRRTVNKADTTMSLKELLFFHFTKLAFCSHDIGPFYLQGFGRDPPMVFAKHLM
jgi:hypothetical protein